MRKGDPSLRNSLLTGLFFFAILALAMQIDLHELEKKFDALISEYKQLVYRLKNKKRHRLQATQIEEVHQTIKENERTRLQILMTLTNAINTTQQKPIKHNFCK